MTVEELKNYVDTDLSNPVLEAKLQGLEMMIRSYTHNNFQERSIRSKCSSNGAVISGVHRFISVGDTVEISGSTYNNGIHTILTIADGVATVSGTIYPEETIFVTKVFYPEDVVQGAICMMEWDINQRDKVGVASETISRHSVTYFNMDGDNSIVGFPRSLVGFLEPYRKARF